MNRKTIDIRLTPDWVEVPSQQGHAHQRRIAPAGILRISLQPPPWEETPPKEMMEGYLMRLIHSLGMPLGELVSSACEDFTMGPAAICVYEVPKVGLVAFCLIAADIALFCTFEQTRGTQQEYEKQMIEALCILQRSAIV